ncbi:MAG: TetR/AcrR family transcriptional regulator [Pseudomonadota bacterium]
MARPVAKDHDAKRLAILKTAARVCAEEGVARASMSVIARACGISKATIYHYYDSKEALLFDILDSYLAALRDRLCAVDAPLAPAPEQLHRITRETLLAYEGMDHEHKIQTEVMALLSPPQQEVLRGYQRDMVARMGAILAALAPDTLRNDPAKLREATMSVFGMLNWFYMWNRSAGRRERERYAAQVARMTIGGVEAL